MLKTVLSTLTHSHKKLMSRQKMSIGAIKIRTTALPITSRDTWH